MKSIQLALEKAGIRIDPTRKERAHYEVLVVNGTIRYCIRSVPLYSESQGRIKEVATNYPDEIASTAIEVACIVGHPTVLTKITLGSKSPVVTSLTTKPDFPEGYPQILGFDPNNCVKTT